ncbi:MAG TPA: hypothetical protein VHK70_08510 [Burkholderiaceae bacterium]|nr:hypothetical protein [Burkholderiaceae bacterium]
MATGNQASQRRFLNILSRVFRLYRSQDRFFLPSSPPLSGPITFLTSLQAPQRCDFYRFVNQFAAVPAATAIFLKKDFLLA